MQEETGQPLTAIENLPHSQSFKLKLSFTERSLQRIKQENSRLLQRILKLEQDISVANNSKNTQIQRIKKLQVTVDNLQKEKQLLEKKIQIRTQRHEVQHSRTLSKTDQEIIEKRIKKSENQLLLIKGQRDSFNDQYKMILKQLECEKESNKNLRMQIFSLKQNSLRDNQKNQHLESLYLEKITILEGQNSQLKKQIESLILQVKLFERQKQIEGLLNYEHKIGVEAPLIKIPIRQSQFYTQQDSLLHRNISDLYECCCDQLQLQIVQRDQLIDLLKQKNQRLSKEVESIKQRNHNLQNIICNQVPLS